MPNYLSDIIGDEEKKKDKSIVGRMKRALGYKDYEEELPHEKENLEDKPWESVTTSTTPPKEPKKRPPLPKNTDDAAKDLPINEAERLAEQRKKIKKHVGGWSNQ